MRLDICSAPATSAVTPARPWIGSSHLTGAICFQCGSAGLIQKRSSVRMTSRTARPMSAKNDHLRRSAAVAGARVLVAKMLLPHSSGGSERIRRSRRSTRGPSSARRLPIGGAGQNERHHHRSGGRAGAGFLLAAGRRKCGANGGGAAQRPSDAESEAYMWKAEEDWAAQAVRPVPGLMERILADDYFGVSSKGDVRNKARPDQGPGRAARPAPMCRASSTMCTTGISATR